MAGASGAMEPLRLGRPLKQRQAIVAGTTVDEAFEAWQTA